MDRPAAMSEGTVLIRLTEVGDLPRSKKYLQGILEVLS